MSDTNPFDAASEAMYQAILKDLTDDDLILLVEISGYNVDEVGEGDANKCIDTLRLCGMVMVVDSLQTVPTGLGKCMAEYAVKKGLVATRTSDVVKYTTDK